MDLRTVPETPPEYLFGLLQKHVEQPGYHLVKGEPTDADRAAYDKLASLTGLCRPRFAHASGIAVGQVGLRRFGGDLYC